MCGVLRGVIVARPAARQPWRTMAAAMASGAAGQRSRIDDGSRSRASAAAAPATGRPAGQPGGGPVIQGSSSGSRPAGQRGRIDDGSRSRASAAAAPATGSQGERWPPAGGASWVQGRERVKRPDRASRAGSIPGGPVIQGGGPDRQRAGLSRMHYGCAHVGLAASLAVGAALARGNKYRTCARCPSKKFF